MRATEATDNEPVSFRATVCTPVAPMHAEPRIASPMVSQQLSGHTVDVLEPHGEWWRARGADGYEGWMHQGFLSRDTPPPGDGARISLGCTVGRHGRATCKLPLLAVLGAEDQVESGEAVTLAELATRFPRDAAAIAETARREFVGTSYLWGGITPWGADCSGLAQSAYALHGIALPRDAWQQAECGQDAGRDRLVLEPADLLFFSDRPDRRVTHVGMSLGEGRMVHLALSRGGYHVEQLADVSDAFVKSLGERFLFARRIL